MHRWPAMLLAGAAVLVACGGGSRTEAPSRNASTAAPPTRFESTQYPYALALPAGRSTGSDAATQRWNGKAEISQDSVYVDRIFTANAVLHVFGLAWRADLPSLARTFAERQARDHDCSPRLLNRRAATVAGAPALAYIQGSCGSAHAVFTRVVVLHDGYALVAFTQTSPGHVQADIDELLRDLAGLEWRSTSR
jgi:hypothetical protein